MRRGLIQAIIGLPANLFYGTGIPACIIVIDKAGAAARRGIFMIDAAQGFLKDGAKNRLRERDIHRIVDTFKRQDSSHPRYARLVGLDEIEKNDFNLNLPRYIDSSTPEDPQDIDAHLNGGIPEADVLAPDTLGRYWAVCPQLKDALFQPRRPGYLDLTVPPAGIKAAIHQHPEFQAFIRLRKEKAIEYEEYLARIADVAKKVSAGKAEDTPTQIKTAGQLALFNNLKDHVVTDAAQQADVPWGDASKALDTALLLDATIKTKRPDGWRGVVAKEQMVKQAMFDVLKDVHEVNRLFPIVFAQKEY